MGQVGGCAHCAGSNCSGPQEDPQVIWGVPLCVKLSLFHLAGLHGVI